MVKISETKEGTVHKGRPTYRMEKGSDKMCTDVEKKTNIVYGHVYCAYIPAAISWFSVTPGHISGYFYLLYVAL